MGGEWEAGEDAAFLAGPCASTSGALRPVCYERVGSTLDLTHEPAAPRTSMTDLSRTSVGKGWSSTELRAVIGPRSGGLEGGGVFKKTPKGIKILKN